MEMYRSYRNTLRLFTRSKFKYFSAGQVYSFIDRVEPKHKITKCEPGKCDNSAVRPTYVKVALTGAVTGSGKYCALMLKQCPLIDELSLYDEIGSNVAGMALDLSHIDTRTMITAYEGLSRVKNCLQIYKKCCVYDPSRIFGVASVSSMRANTLVSLVTGVPPQKIVVPLCGGHGRSTTVPVLSKCKQCEDLPPGQVDCLVKLIREADDTITHMKEDKGAADLSQGFAAARFIVNIVNGVRRMDTCLDGAFVKQPEAEGSRTFRPTYFTSQVDVGLNGVEAYYNLELSARESKLLQLCINDLCLSIKTGECYVTGDAVDNKNFIQKFISKPISKMDKTITTDADKTQSKLSPSNTIQVENNSVKPQKHNTNSNNAAKYK